MSVAGILVNSVQTGFPALIDTLGRWVGQDKGPAEGDERLLGVGVLQVGICIWLGLTLLPFFSFHVAPPPSWRLLPCSGCAAVPCWCGPCPGFDEPAPPDCSQEGAEDGELAARGSGTPEKGSIKVRCLWVREQEVEEADLRLRVGREQGVGRCSGSL